MYKIDMNCDLGEGGLHDAELMKYISSCNIACGGHFGDNGSIRQTVKLAMDNGVKIGAHPSYPDLAGFGRVSMDLSKEELKATLRKQILALKKITESAGASVHHIKPHGALYNDIATDPDKAHTVIDTVLSIDPDLILFVPYKSVIESLAHGKLKIWREVFADRAYTEDYKLQSRKLPGAVINDPEEVLEIIKDMVLAKNIKVARNKTLKIDFETICIHSDTQNSPEILKYLSSELKQYRIQIRK